jgi:alpha-beta hydrolase superfamily lysophospholipase
MQLLKAPPASRVREDAVALVESHSSFLSFDSTELFYRAWIPDSSQAPANAVLFFHRGHEHSGRLDDLVRKLELGDDVAYFACDARGHGRSPGERGYAPSFATFVRDADAFVRFISQKHDIALKDIAVIGHSVGACIAAAWVHDYASPIRAMVLATPALRIKLYVPFAMPALRLLRKIKPRAFITSYVRPRMLTHDEQQARAYAEDPLISKQIANNVLLDLRDTSDRLIANAGAIETPTLILAAGNDWVVKNSAIRKFYKRLGATTKDYVVFDSFGHAIFHEVDRHVPVARVRKFLKRAFDAGSHDATEQLIASDKSGYTHDVYTKLSKPGPILCYKRTFLAAQRLFLKTIGRLSSGISLGWRSGFNSGPMLDYVYRNQPRGLTPLGKLIDYFYLNAPGWRGIRQRKIHLKQLLQRAILEQHHKDGAIEIVDIASGPGRYLLETLSELPRQINVHARLQDRDPAGLARGVEAAATFNLANVTFAQGDAFDEEALASLSPRPTIGIVSGLYELFSDNHRVLSSLRGLARAIPAGGHLIYTNQPWHPQLEMIARCLTHADGSAWIMRCRTQAEMDALVRSAGFEKVDMLIDDTGIFTVSLARRLK